MIPNLREAELAQHWPSIQALQSLAEHYGIKDIFQDAGGKMLQIAIRVGVDLSPERNGPDATDRLGNEYEIKTTDISRTKSGFSISVDTFSMLAQSNVLTSVAGSVIHPMLSKRANGSPSVNHNRFRTQFRVYDRYSGIVVSRFSAPIVFMKSPSSASSMTRSYAVTSALLSSLETMAPTATVG